MPHRKRLALFGVLVAGTITVGCYHPLPLTPETVENSLTPPSMEVIRVQAKSVRHPLLRPIDFDERDGLSPDEAAVLAVLANPSLRSVRDQRGIAAGQVIQAGILPNPTFSGEGEMPVKMPGEVDGYTMGMAWDVSGLISLGTKIKAAKAQAASVELDIAWQEWQVAQAAKTAVYRCMGLELQLAAAEQVERRLKENAETVRSAVEEGLTTAVNLAAANAALEEARAATLDIRQELHKQRVALNRTLGLPPVAEVLIQKDVRLPSKVALPPAAELVDGLADRRLDLVALRRGYDSQEATYRAAILARFPKLELGILHGKDNGNFYKMGPTIAVDIPALDMNQGNIAIEKATRQKLFDEFTARVFEARSEIATFLAEIDSITQKIAYAEAAVPVLERLVKTYEAALAGGNADILSFYGAQNDLAKKQIEVLKLRQELVEMQIGLELASGRYLSGEAAPAAPAADGQTQQKEALP
ncbi:MAG: TolC family protein [Planctomycetota bacterium]|nr:TolC family protein [Planctomycetota bacterium]